MKRTAFVALTILLGAPQLAGGQDRVREYKDRVVKEYGMTTLEMSRDKVSGEIPDQFTATVRSRQTPVWATFHGVCAESMSIYLRAISFNGLDVTAFRESGSGSDLPIADPLNIMNNALVEHCVQLQVLRIKLRVQEDSTGKLLYQGTLTRAGNWQLQDGYVSTAYDKSHEFFINYADPLTGGGINYYGGCEEKPLLYLTRQHPGPGRRNWKMELTLPQFEKVAGIVSERYAEECPQVSRLKYILAPMPRLYLCASGRDCYLFAARNPETREWEIDRSEFVGRRAYNPILDADDMTEVLAAGEFRIIHDYTQFFAYYFEAFIDLYSDHCRKHIDDPVSREIRSIVQSVNAHGTVTNEEQIGMTRSIVIERKYAPAFDRYLYSWKPWAAKKMADDYQLSIVKPSGVDGAIATAGSLVAYVRQIARALDGNCTDDRIQTVYQNLYNYAYGDPAITGKYTTNKQPASEIPARASGYSAPYYVSEILKKQRAEAAKDSPQPEPLPAKDASMGEALGLGSSAATTSAPAPAEKAAPVEETARIEDEQETMVAKAEAAPAVKFDEVVGRMAMNAGKYRASAENCLGKSMPEIETAFIDAVADQYPERIAEVQAAYAGHYAKRQANLAKKKKKCQQKTYNTQKRKYEYNISLLAPGTSG